MRSTSNELESSVLSSEEDDHIDSDGVSAWSTSQVQSYNEVSASSETDVPCKR